MVRSSNTFLTNKESYLTCFIAASVRYGLRGSDRDVTPYPYLPYSAYITGFCRAIRARIHEVLR